MRGIDALGHLYAAFHTEPCPEPHEQCARCENVTACLILGCCIECVHPISRAFVPDTIREWNGDA